jgi:AraC family transcriptional regulator
MQYVRARRLSEAARALAAGAPDILSVALEAGYGSHEAFTRAFRDRFRSDALKPFAPNATLQPSHSWSQSRWTKACFTTLEPPRFENGKTLLIAGLSERYDCDSSKAIPAQWQCFMPYIGNIPGQIGRTAYGVLLQLR